MDAITGAHSGVQGLAKKINSRMRVSHISIPGRLSRLAFGTPKSRLEDSENPNQREQEGELPGGATDTPMPLPFQHDHTQSHPYALGHHHANLRRRSTQRGYQLLHQTGFRDSLGFRDNLGREGSSKPTALESSLLALMDVEQPEYQAEPSKTPAADQAAQSSSSASTSGKARASFLLADFEGIESTTAHRKAPWYISDSALFLFGSENKLRIVCHKLTETKVYKRFILIVILVSIVTTIETGPEGKTSEVTPLFIDVANRAVLVVSIFMPSSHNLHD